MKKFFLSFAFAVLAIASAFAGNETLQVATTAFWGIETAPESGKGVDLTSAEEPTLLKTQGDVTLSLDKASATTNFRLWNQSGTLQFRTYKNSTMTIEAGGENITAINIVGTGFATSFTANAGELTSSASEANWTGSATSVVITTAVNAKIFSIEVVYGGSAPVVTVATPVISGTTPFDDETEVSISCETTGASIYYTLDGSTPSNQSTQYTGAFDINATTTVKAIAYKDNTASSVASKEFVKNEPAPAKIEVATVAALNALEDNTEFVYISTMTVSGQTGKYLYAQDATAGTLIYGTAPVYAKGAVIPAGWSGKKVTYNGAPEVTNMTDMAEATETAELVAKEMTVTEAADMANFSVYGVIKNVTVNTTDKKFVAEDGSEIAYYDRFKVTFPEVVEDKKFDVTMIVGYYNAPQVFPVAFEEVVEPEAPKYSLVGYINGADYGCEGDYENPGQYVFDEDGKCTVNFNETSYVFVKLTDNSKWFLSEAYVPQAEAFIGETATTTATMVNGANFGEKMQVPAGEVEISLTVTDENTVVLTYSLPGTKEPEKETEYYVAGNFNNWAADGAKMTKNENGIWEYAFQVEAGSYAFKVTDGTWNHSWPASDYAFSANATSDVLITFNEETQEVNAVVTPIVVPDPEISFTVEGDYDEDQEAYVGSATVKVVVENMPEGGKVQYRVDLRDEQMVAPAEEEDLEWTDYTEAGVVLTQSAIVTVRVLDAAGEELASNEVEVTVVSKSTGINDINVNSAKVVKMIENGEVIIVKDGVKYNVMGQKK
ncbi:MAG: chitobiase/beta-hexosaminidase C-terminal domain-containing protein [Muribaculaceae bacterium]|nr:chitobiase/beta-hexosaminidase C-terminal domain-containing protein [Muribaculaceae bacterium]